MRRKVKLDKKSLKNSSLLICYEIKLQTNIYILKHKKSKKAFIVSVILLKHLDVAKINCKMKINFERKDSKFKLD